MKLVINRCYGGFGLSEAAYEKLIEWGVPVRKYIEEERGPEGLYKPQHANDGEVIFDRTLTPIGESFVNDIFWKFRSVSDRYWETWTNGQRDHPLVLRVVEELGSAASGRHAQLEVVEIPDGVEYEIAEYDGIEHVAEQHRTWR